jgi:predicted HicB family RNase H-like nuclease
MNKPEEYGICIRLIRQGDDYVYEGRVNELPDLKVYCDSYSEAYEELLDAIGTTQELLAEQGREMPPAEPLEENFSGRVTLRMSKSLHRCAHERAQRDGVSLNQWIVEAVGCRIAPAQQHTASGTFYVVSPMRNTSSSSLSPCMQQATTLHTLATPGGPVTFLVTPGVVESSKQLVTNQWRTFT